MLFIFYISVSSSCDHPAAAVCFKNESKPTEKSDQVLPELLTIQPKFKQFVQEKCMKTCLSIFLHKENRTDCALDDAGE